MIMAKFYVLWENLEISDLKEELNKYWDTLSCPSSDGHKFWGHEWEKHDTFSLNLDEHSYFESALSLRENMDILGALKEAGDQIPRDRCQINSFIQNQYLNL